MFSCSSEKEGEIPQVVRPLKTMLIAGGQETHFEYPGKVRASQHVDLSFRVSGPLVELPVNEGDEITKGQLLAKIDQRDFKIALSKSVAQFDKANADYERAGTLFKSNAVSKADLDTTKSNFEVARSNLDKVKANFDDTALKAPFSGRIGKIFVENFQDVQAKQPILSLLDLASLEIEVEVPENVVVTARKEAVRKFAAYFISLPGKEFELETKEFSTQADPVTQTYSATFTMQRLELDDIRIFPGMTAEVHVYLHSAASEVPGKYVVPSIAVSGDNDGDAYVWIVHPDKLTVHKRKVKAGERIAVAGISQLREGMKIRLME